MVNAFSADYIKDLHAYAMSLTGFRYADRNDITMFFDTGSAYTVLSTSTLFHSAELNAEIRAKKDLIIKELQGNQYSRITPSSAFSTATKDCYACMIHNIFLNGKHFDDFYFYIVELNKGLALIGDDISSYCTYHHSLLSDIDIVAFDYEGYVDSFKRKNKSILDLDQLLT